MHKMTHISESDLIRFADGEMDGPPALAIETHLQQCFECRLRLERLKTAADAYSEYQQSTETITGTFA